MARTRRTNGFSTIELLIVVAVVLIIAASAIPMIAPAIQSYRLIGDARSIGSSLALARMRAASHFTKAQVLFDLNNNTFEVDVWDPAANAGAGAFVLEGGVQPLNQGDLFPCDPPPGACNAPRTVAMPTNMATAVPNISGTAQQNPFVIFNSRGISIDTGNSPTNRGSVYLTNNQTAAFLAITVNIAGQPQIWRWDAASNAWNLM